MKADYFHAPFIAEGFEGQFDARLTGLLTQRLQRMFQACGYQRIKAPLQVQRAFVGVIRQGLAERQRRHFPSSPRAILGERAQATVGAGLAANQAGARLLDRWAQEGVVGRQLPSVLGGRQVQ